MLLMLLTLSLAAEPQLSREYQIKAAYLPKLARFINWPEPKRSDIANKQSITICVWGKNPFGHFLDDNQAKFQSKNRAIQLAYIPLEHIPKDCHLVFIAATNSPEELTRALIISKQLDLLSVGEDIEFIDQGGLLALVLENNGIQLHVNLSEAKKVGFEMSGNLLEVAKNVR
jgi:hypothetical protein